MSMHELLPLLPFITVSTFVIFDLLAIAIYRNHRTTALLTGIGLVLAIIATLLADVSTPIRITPLIILDRYSMFFVALFLSTAFMVTLLSYRYMELLKESRKEEYYLLLLLASLGVCVVVSSNHFVSFFLGLEILSVSLYALIGYKVEDPLGQEASIKYLILTATSDSFLLFGIALIYADTGQLEFTKIAAALTSGHIGFLLPGLGLLIAGLGFKLSLVPFHMWTPDVYQGAPAPITGFLASASKGAVFALMLRYFTKAGLHTNNGVLTVFAIIAVASMFGGNLLALLQNRVKRILAYSSIAHFGYLVTAFLASGAFALTAVTYYLAAYFVTILGAFGVMSVMSGTKAEPDLIDSYRGMFWKKPFLGSVFSATLLSLAGIPLTAGFVGKFYVMAAGVNSHLWLLVVSLVASSIIGLFYYLRIISVMFSKDLANLDSSGFDGTGMAAAALALAVLTIALLWLGIWPGSLIALIQTIAPNPT